MKQLIQAPLIKEEIRNLHAGDSVLITGTIYTARDAAHKRMQEALKNGEKIPLAMEGNDLLYGAFTGKRRQTDRFCRTYNRESYGQICTGAS